MVLNEIMHMTKSQNGIVWKRYSDTLRYWNYCWSWLSGILEWNPIGKHIRFISLQEIFYSSRIVFIPLEHVKTEIGSTDDVSFWSYGPIIFFFSPAHLFLFSSFVFDFFFVFPSSLVAQWHTVKYIAIVSVRSLYSLFVPWLLLSFPCTPFVPRRRRRWT